MKLLARIASLGRLQLILLVLTIWTLVSVLVLIFVPAARKGPLGFGSPAPLKALASKELGFSVSYPGNWTAFETPQGNHGDREVVAVILVAGKVGAYVTIAHRPFLNANIDDVVEWGHSRATSHPGYSLISLRRITGEKAGGVAEEYVWFSNAQYRQYIHCLDRYVLFKNGGYVLSFCSTERDWLSLAGIFEQMAESFVASGGSQ